MKKYNQPTKDMWESILQRPVKEAQALTVTVTDILDTVARDGDTALLAYNKKFDGVDLQDLLVSPEEVVTAIASTPQDLKDAIGLAKQNIEAFHRAQVAEEEVVETMPGVRCWRKSVAIERVGLYVPGGSAPLFSTVLMLAIPAMIAGCQEVVICTPCRPDKTIDPSIIYTAHLVGVDKIYKVGGAQAIAAMAYGTETIPKVDKIFGPGNQYVTKAKELVQQSGTAIDMPAGPSEVLVIADRTCNPAFVAADLLSQAEHGPDSQVILLTDDAETVGACLAAVEVQLADLPRREIAQQALESSKAVVLSSMTECLQMSNAYAPEHLIIASDQASVIAQYIVNAGSVFLGNYSCESVGDYASGTNHTLPTNGFARMYSGVSLDSFVKKITFQEISQTGLQDIGPSVEIMAAAEQLVAHQRAVSIRLKTLQND
jgi:histidinol dehydrogenase